MTDPDISAAAGGAPGASDTSLSIGEALRRATYCEIGKSPAEPLRALLSHRDELVEQMLQTIALSPAEISRRFDEAPDGRHIYFLHSFAVYLLAHWREPRAFQILLRYLSEAGDLAHEHLQETITEDLHAILARLYDGSGPEPLLELIRDHEADPYVRDACLKCLHALSRMGKLPREDVVRIYAELGEHLRHSGNQELADMLVLTLAELQEPALRPVIDRWFEEDLVELQSLNREDIDRTFADPDDTIEASLILRERMEEGLVEYLSGWAWFKASDPADLRDPWDDVPEPTLDELVEYEASQPYVREGRKIGRNEPCPCGSGKKYKKCCLSTEQA
ncbi:MAG: DUF1186 domain-containing protein [Hyphomicrobiaceae bacterium]